MRRILVCVAMLGLFIVASFAYAQSTKWKGKIEYEDGVKVIKNPKEPLYGGNVFKLEGELTIGVSEGKEEYMFSRISGIAVDNTERLYVLDYKEAHIRVFSKNGAYLKTVGQRGEGPGEMASPYSISINRNNEIMVQDLNNRRMMFYSTKGDHLRSLSTAKMIIVGSKIDSESNIICLVSTNSPVGQVIELRKYDSELNYLISFYSFSRPKRGSTYNPFMPELCWTVSENDQIVCGYPESYEFQVFNHDGKLLRRVIREYRPVKITQDEIEEIKRGLPGPMKIEAPAYHSAYQGLCIDDEGMIYVQTWEKAENRTGYFVDVFDAEGKYMTKIHLEALPLILKKGTMYTIEEYEDGYQYVKRYKVTWNF